MEGAGQPLTKLRVWTNCCQSDTCTARSFANCLTHGWWERPQRTQHAVRSKRTVRDPERRGTQTVRGKVVDDMRNGRVKSRFVAAEVARDVRCDVRAGTPALKGPRMIVTLAAMYDGKQRAQRGVL